MGVSIDGDTPIAGWFIRENPMNMDDFKGYRHLGKHPFGGYVWGNLWVYALEKWV